MALSLTQPLQKRAPHSTQSCAPMVPSAPNGRLQGAHLPRWQAGSWHPPPGDFSAISPCQAVPMLSGPPAFSGALSLSGLANACPIGPRRAGAARLCPRPAVQSSPSSGGQRPEATRQPRAHGRAEGLPLRQPRSRGPSAEGQVGLQPPALLPDAEQPVLTHLPSASFSAGTWHFRQSPGPAHRPPGPARLPLSGPLANAEVGGTCPRGLSHTGKPSGFHSCLRALGGS